MSRLSQIAIGCVGAIFAPILLLDAYVSLGAEPPWRIALYLGMALFCVALALACWMPRSRPFTLRMISAGVFLLVACFLGADGIKAIEGKPNQLVKSIVSFVAFGLPALYVLIVARYPRWGRYAAVFNGPGPKMLLEEKQRSRKPASAAVEDSPAIQAGDLPVAPEGTPSTSG
jgi:hypothetical protein